MEFILNNRQLIYENEKIFIITENNNIKELNVRISSSGYKQITINHKTYLLHRIIAYLFLELDIDNPRQQIDHINRNRLDNRIENLRIVNHQQNNFNRTNTKGYTKKGNKFQARIMLDGKTKYLGYYDTEEEARQVYLNAKQSYHYISPPFNRL